MKPDGEQEFKKAIEMVNACKGTIICGCQVNEQLAESLYYLCKKYVETHKERFK